MSPHSSRPTPPEAPQPFIERRHAPVGPTALSVDMHIHTNFSDAPKCTLDAITERCRETGVGIAVCDHNEIRGAMGLIERGEILCVPALEVGSREKLEFLAYFDDPAKLERFYSREVEPHKRARYFTKLDRSFTQLIPAAKEHGALVCLPHPFGPSYKNVNHGRERKAALFDPRMFCHVDLIEVINGHMRDHRNFKAYMLSEVFEKNVTAGSDAHLPKDIGTIYLRFDRAMDRKGVYDLLHFPIKVGMTTTYRFSNFARTAAGVIPKHLQLFISKKRQREWVMKYANSER